MRRLMIVIIVLLAALLVVLSAFLYVWLGFVDFRATMEPSSMEAAMAMMAVDAATERNAPRGPNPISPTSANLTTGVNLYRTHCAVCHGEPSQPESALVFYPRAPQFLHDPPDMPANENFFIIKNGIRWTGMPAWHHELTDGQIWTIVAFLQRIERLPPDVQAIWSSPSP